MTASALLPASGDAGSTAFAQVNASGRSVVANGVGTPFELSFWESVSGSNDPRQLEAYLAQYPNGTFSGLARAKIAALSPPATAPTTAPVTTAAPVAPAATETVSAPPAAASLAAAPAAPQPSVPVAAPTPAQAAIQPAAPAAPLSLLDQMAALGKGGSVSKPALFTASGPVPARPELTQAAPLTIPDHFCSAIERNQFHDTVYVPAVALADRNNTATIAHLKNVQALHGQALAAKDISGANALAHEATEYKPIADQSYVARTAMTEIFSRIMAVPVTGC